VDKISFYLSRNDLKIGKITLNVISLMSVQGSSRQSKVEIQADKNRLSQTCLSVLEIFWYLWYPGDPPRDAESLGRSLYLWGAVQYGANSTRLQCEVGLSLLNARLLAQTKYGLHLSQFPPNKCQQLSVIINETMLPILKSHRKLPCSVVWGPKGLGGLALNTNIYNVQAQCALTYLV
jgi:hypothetical protein